MLSYGDQRLPFEGINDEDNNAPPASLNIQSINVCQKDGTSVFDIPVSEPANQPTNLVIS